MDQAQRRMYPQLGCSRHRVGTDQALRWPYPRLGSIGHEVRTDQAQRGTYRVATRSPSAPWCSWIRDVPTGYTATQCQFRPGLQLGTLLVRYLLNQSRNIY